MIENKEEKYIHVVWKDPRSRRNYVVGEIIKGEKYKFHYIKDIDDAIKKGFKLFIPFNDKGKEYVSENLFQIFASRLPDPKRRDMDAILKKYNLEEYDEFNLLKQGAELPIDTLKFIEPIIEIDKGFYKEFFVEGVRHYMLCKGKQCNAMEELKEPLFLCSDPQNKYDKKAVKVIDTRGNTIGFIPRYYNEKIADSIADGWNFEVKVKEFNKEMDCNTCLKISLTSK